MEHREWIEFLVDKFITNETKVRCCGSCMGGCINPTTCFICCGFSAQHLNDYIEKIGKDKLNQEFEQRMVR